MSGVKFDQTEKYMACFVNDNEPPTRKIPLNLFNYGVGFSGKLEVSRLYKYFYVYNVPNSEYKVEYSLYSWEPVKVKGGCESAVKQLIDCQDGVVAMLEKDDV